MGKAVQIAFCIGLVCGMVGGGQLAAYNLGHPAAKSDEDPMVQDMEHRTIVKLLSENVRLRFGTLHPKAMPIPTSLGKVSEAKPNRLRPVAMLAG
ncbi:MAG TPA: hypothetical protein VG944_15715 [Fimbriimonas sp.]|nr:hypothetical protein [Fimbriimonas sp.]